LPSLDILKEDRDNWYQVKQNMNEALDEMRIRDSNVVIKELGTTRNHLLEKRIKKTKQTTPATETLSLTLDNLKAVGGAASGSTLDTDHFLKPDMIMVEDLSREQSMVSVRTITPTNSRPSSPK
jgi:hypothetical protein